MKPPVLVKPVPAQVVNERAAFGPFQLNDYIQSPESENALLRFRAELSTGKPLPTGMICTSDGMLTGIPGKGSQGNYQINVTAENDAGVLTTTFVLTIKPSLSETEEKYSDQLKAQVWEALQQHLPVPDISAMLAREITMLDVYYLLERWGVLIIWDAFNLEPPSEKVQITLEGASPHYHVYDRGSCLVATPKDLYDHQRTIADGLMTACAMAREVYMRRWTIEMAGFEKLTRAAWIEVQRLGDEYGKYLEVINFTPSPSDLKIYTSQFAPGRRVGRGE